jgi:hypothetical protein
VICIFDNVKQVIYPQYRKYKNNKAFFKITSEKEWEEIQVLGTKYILHFFTVKILPDRNFIYDMVFDYENNWVKIEEEEYQEVLKKVQAS